MEARKKRYIRSGRQYNHLFPLAERGTITMVKNADVNDTCAFIPKVVNQTLDQTKAIAAQLQGADTYETCKNIWHFVYGHIAYRKDAEGYEQIRSPARTWHDRSRGVDCDCYSTFISSILTNLGIPHQLRIAKYHRDYFQHIYPIVPTANGSYITVDCVTDKFDYEVPYSEKKDYKMDLQYLNGIGFIGEVSATPDYDLNGDGVLELGKLAKKKASTGQSKKQTRQAKKVAKKAAKNNPNAPKKKRGLKKLLNIVNKVNPATLALRNGVLAAMKLNIGKIGSRLRWSYLSPADAAKKNIDPEKFKKLVATRQKLENIFYNAGGKPENMKKAILKGKGNKDKAVHGLGFAGFDGYDPSIEYMDTSYPLSAVLGADIYHSENIDGFDGFEDGELGEPVTLATVAAASGVIATIAGMLRKIGDIFKGGKGQGSEDFSEDANAAADKEISEVKKESNPDGGNSSSSGSSNNSESNNLPVPSSSGGGNSENNSNLPAPSTGSGGGSSDDSNGDTANKSSVAKTTANNSSGDDSDSSNGGGGTGESFWDKHKKWLLPVSIGVGGLVVLGVAMSIGKKPQTATVPSPSLKGLNGTPKQKNHHRKKSTKQQTGKYKKKRAVALL